MPVSIPQDKDLEKLLNGKEVENWGKLDARALKFVGMLESLKGEPNVKSIHYAVLEKKAGKGSRRFVRGYVNFSRGFDLSRELVTYMIERGLPELTVDDIECDIKRTDGVWYQAHYDIVDGPYEERKRGIIDPSMIGMED